MTNMADLFLRFVANERLTRSAGLKRMASNVAIFAAGLRGSGCGIVTCEGLELLYFTTWRPLPPLLVYFRSKRPDLGNY